MSCNDGCADRRKCKRYKIKDGAYTINSTKPGMIVDISLDGLSFRYVDRKRWPTPSPELDIVFGDNDFYLPKIPYVVVTDVITTTDIPDSTFIVKRCGVKFGDLSNTQQMKLQKFIEYNMLEEIFEPEGLVVHA